MASRRRSSATTARPVKKSPSKVIIQEKVTKYTKPLEIKKVTEEKPAKVRPEQTNLSMKDYMDDFQVRMQIHNFEVDMTFQMDKVLYIYHKYILNQINSLMNYHNQLTHNYILDMII